MGIRLPSARERSTKIVQPQSWFAGKESDQQRRSNGHSVIGPDQQRKTGQTESEIYVPTDHEKNLLMRGQMCHGCEFFRYRDGQERIVKDRVVDMLAAELKMNAMMENLNPADLGNCLAKAYMLTHYIAGHNCESYKPKDSHAKKVWDLTKESISIGRDRGEIA